MDPKHRKVVPEQVKGAASGARETFTASTEQEAKQLFEKAKANLQNIHRWHELSGPGSATFALTDPSGKTVNEPPRKGLLIRIDLPGPGTVEGQGYDWVRIEEIVEKRQAHSDLYAIRVRPVQAPGSEDPATAHFYTEEATSSFFVQRNGKEVTAAEEGRNEIVNTETENVTDKVRNALVATGAQMGLAKVQWKALVVGVMEK